MGGHHFCCQSLPFLPALTALIHLFLALALSKVHTEVSVSSLCTAVPRCCHSSGWLLRKQPYFVIQSPSLVMIPLSTPAFRLCLFLPLVRLPLSALHSCCRWQCQLVTSLLLGYKWWYRSTNQVLRALISIFPGKKKMKEFSWSMEIAGVKGSWRGGSFTFKGSWGFRRHQTVCCGFCYLLSYLTATSSWEIEDCVKASSKEKRKCRTYTESWPRSHVADSLWSSCEATNVTKTFHKKDFPAWFT